MNIPERKNVESYVPYIVNMAFAAELYLKLLLIHNRKSIGDVVKLGHRLSDLNKRLDKALEDMEDIQSQLADLDAQMEKIAAAEETKKQVYGVLQSFDILFDVMDNADKKLLIKELIEKIELYPRQKLSGQWIKTIHFKFPMNYNDNNEASCAVCFDLNRNFLPKKSTDESIVCLVRQEN